MTVIASIDGPNRDIYLHADTVGASVHPIDIYKEMRTIRRTNESLRGYDVFLSAKGNDAKGGGKFTERYVICNLGTRIIPFDTSHELTIIGTIITDDGQEGISCFDRVPLTPTTIVDINYVPPQVEVVRAEAELAAIKFISFSDKIAIDINGESGTGLNSQGVQLGYGNAPVNNVADALLIAAEFGINDLHFHNNFTIIEDISGFNISSDSSLQATIIFASGCVTENVHFHEVTIQGDLNGQNHYFNGTFFSALGVSGIDGIGINTRWLGAGPYVMRSAGKFKNDNGSSIGTGPGSRPQFYYTGVPLEVSFRHHGGAVKVFDCGVGTFNCWDFDVGEILIDVSCDGGSIVVRGAVYVVNEAAVPSIVTDLSVPRLTTTQTWGEDISSYVNGTAGNWLYKKVLTIKKFVGLK